MQSPKNPPKALARLQNGLPFWPQEREQSLSLEEIARLSGCSKRRIRHLIELGLVDHARKVGSRSSYSRWHLRQARAVERLLTEGRFTLTELAWLSSQDAILALNLVEGLTPQELLLSLFQPEADQPIGELVGSRSAKSAPFQRRMLAAIVTASGEALLVERSLIAEAQEALRTAMKLDG